MANFVEPSIAEEIRRQSMMARSLREIAADLEIAPNTVRRYRQIFAPELKSVRCPCGAPAFHRGWCSERYARSEARQAFIAGWAGTRGPRVITVKRSLLNYPFIDPASPMAEGEDLVLLVNKAVPRGLPEQLRADVCQEILLAIISGELEQSDISKEMKRFIRQTRGLVEAHYMAFSIDTPRADGRSWHDLLAAPERRRLTLLPPSCPVGRR